MVLFLFLATTLLITGAGLLQSSLIAASNFGYFLAGILLLIALIPVVTELFSKLIVIYSAIRSRAKPRALLHEQELSGKYDNGFRVTLSYGISGLICFSISTVLPLI